MPKHSHAQQYLYTREDFKHIGHLSLKLKKEPLVNLFTNTIIIHTSLKYLHYKISNPKHYLRKLSQSKEMTNKTLKLIGQVTWWLKSSIQKLLRIVDLQEAFAIQKLFWAKQKVIEKLLNLFRNKSGSKAIVAKKTTIKNRINSVKNNKLGTVYTWGNNVHTQFHLNIKVQ